VVTAKGVITASTSDAATSVVTPTGFSASQPLRAIILWCAYNTADGTVADARFHIGFGTNDGGSIQQGGVGVYCKGSSNADSDTATANNTTWILRGFSDATPTLEFEIDLTAFSDTSFTLTYTDAPATAIKIHWMAIGGADVSAARVGSTIVTSGVGTQDVTVAASWGQPNMVFNIGARQVALGDGAAAVNGGLISLGVGTSPTVRQATTWNARDAQTASNVALWQKQRWHLDLNNGSAHNEWDLGSTYPTDGFQIDKIVSGSGSIAIVWLAVKGTFSSAIGVDTALTAGSTDDIAAGFAPSGALLWGGNLEASALKDSSHTDLGQFFVGGTDGTNEGCASLIDDDAALTMNTWSQHSEAQIIEYYTPITPTLVSEADASFNGNNLRLTWGDLDTVAREYNYLILGPPPAGAASLIYDPAPQRVLRSL
jgi:hypothetical protein